MLGGGSRWQHSRCPVAVGKWKLVVAHGSAELAQSGQAGHSPSTSMHVLPSEAQQVHPLGHVVRQLVTRASSATVQFGRHRG